MTIVLTWESVVVMLMLLGIFLGGAKLYGDLRELSLIRKSFLRR